MTTPPPEWIDQGNNAIVFFSVALMGFFVAIFGRPIPKQAKAKTTSTRRKPKAKRAKTAKITKPQKAAKKPKAKQQTKQTKIPEYTPDQIFRIEEMFRRGRGY